MDARGEQVARDDARSDGGGSHREHLVEGSAAAAGTRNSGAMAEAESQVSTMMEPIAAIEMFDGTPRLVNEGPDGRRYVYNDDGEQVYGDWFISSEECSAPIVMDDREFCLDFSAIKAFDVSLCIGRQTGDATVL